MTNKPKLNVEKKLVSSQNDLSGKVILEDVVGRLDEFDFRVIQDLIDIYDQVHPYPSLASIDRLNAQIRKQRKDFQEGYNKFGELSKQTGLRHTMSMPESLLIAIKQGYPNIIRDPIQYRQFLKRFPRFQIAEKI